MAIRLLPLLALLVSGVAHAVSPTVDSVTTTADSPNDTDQSIDIPATVEAGDLLIACMATDGDRTITWDNSTAGTWTLISDDNGGASTNTLTCYGKDADGTEDGLTLGVTTSGNERAASFVVRVLAAEWDGDIAQVYNGTAATATSTTPDPPNVSPGVGSQDWLVLAVTSINSGLDADTITVFPYADDNTSFVEGSNAANGIRIGLATDGVTATSVDPGTFTISTSLHTVTQTILVRPSAGGSIITQTTRDDARRRAQ